MPNAINRNLLYLLSLMVILMSACSRENQQVILKQALQSNWQMQSSAKISASGRDISTEKFSPQNWYRAKVPGSVLGSLVADDVYKDVFYGRNMANISDSSFGVPWWFRTSFDISEKDSGQITRLQFNGINYKADIWLNGQKIASSDTVEGGFRRFIFNVSKIVKAGKNILAVKVTRPYPGDLTLGFVDWNPNPPDHNMGIWRDVKLIISGPVSIEQPSIVTRVDTATLDHADLFITTVLQNHSGKVMKGILKGKIGSNISFTKEITLQANEIKKVAFDPTHYNQLAIDHPHLWWVRTWGNPYLYDLRLSFEQGGTLSDSENVRFGIRQISDYITADGHRGFKLNGKKILIKGGGWTDPMLLNATPAYEEAGIDYAVHMNLNALRMEGFWGKNQHLYDLCDEKGILLMVGFSCQWEWTEYLGTNKEDEYSAFDTPKQNNIAAKSWRDQIIWFRNHPSIFLWLYGSDKRPRPSLEERYIAILKQYDTTRPAINSAADYTPGIAAAPKHISKLSGPSAVKMRGPYDYVPPDYWYIDTLHGGAFGFNTETGPGPQIPVLESLKKMIPSDSLWPIGSAWLYHAARHNFHNLTHYNNAIVERLGKPVGLKDYLRKAQFINYEGMRAMFEAFEANRYKATGIIQWMYNASWPKLWWQLYDFYLMPTGAFYGARKANEPIHISYNYGKNAIEIMNNTLDKKDGLSAEITVLNFDLKPGLKKTVTVHELNGRQTKDIFRLPAQMPLSKTWFLDLKLYDSRHHPVSTNFYALSTQKDKLDEAKTTWYFTPQSQYADLKMLQHLPKVKLEASQSSEQKNDTTFVKVKIKNPTSHLAFMVHLDLKKKRSNQSVVPIFWEENYISLLPGEERTVSGYCHTKDLDKEQPKVIIDGWNIE